MVQLKRLSSLKILTLNSIYFTIVLTILRIKTIKARYSILYDTISSRMFSIVCNLVANRLGYNIFNSILEIAGF